jgi:hypothetical protein
VIGSIEATCVAGRLLVALQKINRPKIVRRKKLHSFITSFHSNVPYWELCDMFQAAAAIHVLHCAVCIESPTTAQPWNNGTLLVHCLVSLLPTQHKELYRDYFGN